VHCLPRELSDEVDLQRVDFLRIKRLSFVLLLLLAMPSVLKFPFKASTRP
jgi:hypothetical protein